MTNDDAFSGRPLAALTRLLEAGEAHSRDLADAACAAIADEGREGAKIYLRHDPDQVRAAADASDMARRAGHSAGPLAGLPISIKDLFDVAGQVTRAGSTVLSDAAPADRDAPVVARLKAAGAVLTGRTNMTEFAFSGLGLNPHYGTPGNSRDRGRIPGGSSSGAAISVTDGMAAAGIGSDTGGSVRIPAALTGLAGFKPTRTAVPLTGVLPLAGSLNSIGPLAPTVACCALLHAVMSGAEPSALRPMPVAGLRLGVPRNHVLEGLDSTVARRFDHALSILGKAGALLEDIRVPEYDALSELNAKGGLAAPEAFAWHRDLLARRGDGYDRRVRLRIQRGEAVPVADYIDTLAARPLLRESFEARLSRFDAFIMPTVPVVAPEIAPLETDDDLYIRTNQLILRNPSTVNFLDGCAVTVPCHDPDDLPVGLMLVASAGHDRRLLEVAAAVEPLVAPHSA